MRLSKSLIAVALVLCMIFAVMPAFGATIYAPVTEIQVPVEGMALTSTAAGTNGSHWKIVIGSSGVQALGISHSYTSETWVNNNGPLTGTVFDGLVISGTAALSDADREAAPDKTVVEFTFTNMPLTRVSYRSGNAMSFCVAYDGLADRKYVSNVKIWDAEKKEAVEFDGTLSIEQFKNSEGSRYSYSKPTNLRLDRGTWRDTMPVDTGAFPENTIFITERNMTAQETNTGSVESSNIGEYTYRYNARGEFGIYVPAVSGTYYAYALRGYHSSGGSRDSKISVHTSLIDTNNQMIVSSGTSLFSGANGADTSKTGHSAFWCADAYATKYKLTKGVPFMVVREKGGSYDRLIGVALVPAKADGTNPMLDVTDSTWTYANLPVQAKLELMEKTTAGQVSLGNTVTVFVNGVETVVPAMAARIKGYDYADSLPKLSKLDLKGHAISGATVLDALLTATSPVAGNEKGYASYDVVNDGITKGGLTNKYAVVVNGKTCLDIDQTELKQFDVIETRAFAPDNFVPQVAGMASNNPKLLIGFSNSGSNGLQYGFDIEKLAGLGLFADGNYTDLDGCMLSGYLYPRYVEERWGTVAPNLDYDKSKIYFDGIHLMYRGSGDYYYADATDRSKVTSTHSLDEVLLENGTLHHPYKVTDAAGEIYYDYYGENLWFLNNKTENNVVADVDKESGRFVLTTDGAKLFTLFVVTYAEDGTVEKVERKNDIYINWTSPYVGELKENQAIFAWDTNVLDGTTFSPLMEKVVLADIKKESFFEKTQISNLVTTFIGDAKTSRGFSWSAEPAYDNMVVEYAPFGTVFENEKKQVSATYESYNNRLYYKADLKNLKAGTEYVYRIGDVTHNKWSEKYRFTTEEENVKEFSFLGITDTQSASWDGGFYLLKDVMDAALTETPDMKFMVHLGDMVDSGGNESQWKSYFDAIKGYSETLPHMAVIGNHELPKDEMLSGKYYSLFFNNPDNGRNALGGFTSEGLTSPYIIGAVNNFGESAYSFDYGDVHFAVINSGMETGSPDQPLFVAQQREWLKNDLENSNAKWKIVMLHIGLYLARDYRLNNKQLEDIIDECEVDLVLQGHDHYVFRTYPIRNGEIVTKENPSTIKKGTGTVYTILGSAGPKRYDDTSTESPYCAFFYKSEKTLPTYTTFKVSENKIEAVTKQIDGVVVDTYTIVDTEE